MKSDPEDNLGCKPLRTLNFPVIIDFPAANSAGMPPEVAIGPGCTMSVSGHVDTLNFPATLRIIYVSAQIGTGPVVSQAFPEVTSFSLGSIGGARWSNPAGAAQSISLQIRTRDIASTEEADLPSLSASFIGTSGPNECQYYNSFALDTIAAKPVQEVLPRYFRVSADFGAEAAFGRLAGGLLSMNTIYLAYDIHGSTPECPVWRDIGNAPGSGNWLLRVARSNGVYEARLSSQIVTETCVMPPLVTRCRYWSFQKKNYLHGVVEIGSTMSNVTLIVEPA